MHTLSFSLLPQKGDLVQLYESLTMEEIARRYGICAQTVSKYFRQWGIPIKGNGYFTERRGIPALRGRKRPEHSLLMRERYQSGLLYIPRGHNSGSFTSESMRDRWADPEFRRVQHELRIGRIPWNKGKMGLFRHSKDFIERLSSQRVGPLNPSWKGGKPPYGAGWKRARRLARERDKGICQLCERDEKRVGRRFHIHHIVPYRIGHTHELDNLITLCATCHVRWEMQSLWYYITEVSKYGA